MIRRAFTLVELLVVIAIVGLLSSVAVVSMSGAREKARIAAGQSFERSVLDAAGSEALVQWDFDDCTGTGIAATSVADVSGNGNNATPTGSPQWSADTPAGKGCSLSLNGTNQFASGTKSISELASNSFTVSLWAKRASTGAIHIAFSMGTVEANKILVIGFRASNKFTCAFYANDLDTSAVYTDTDWHQWTCSYDASANKRNIYKDGALVATDSPSSPFQGLGVPEISHYGSFPFPGKIDNVRVYAKSLTAQAIQKLYAEGARTHSDEVAAR